MKDLFVFTADSDAEALFRAVLKRPRDLKIRPISFEVERLTGRDSGMVQFGPEIARERVKKSEFQKLLLVWDHHGSGRESLSIDAVVGGIQVRLDSSTWTNRSGAIAIVPELEEWLWHCPHSLAKHLRIDKAELEAITDAVSKKFHLPVDRCRGEKPKELFAETVYRKQRRGLLPGDYASIAALASMKAWTGSETFTMVAKLLQNWFPE